MAENIFNEDLSFKEFFNKLPARMLIPLINELCGTNLSLETEISRESTEDLNLLGTLGKGSIRGDFAATLTDGTEKTQVIIEFQSSKHKDMAYRMFIYAFHIGNDPDNDSCTIFPKTAVIYTSLTNEKEEKSGKIPYKLYFDQFLFQGAEYTKAEPVTVLFPYINTSAMEMKDFENSGLSPLQVFHLLKFKRIPTLLNKENALNEIESVKNYVDTQEETLFMELFTNVIVDIMEKSADNKKVNKEVVDMLEENYGKTWVQIFRDEGRDEGRKLGRDEGRQERERMIVNAYKKAQSAETVADFLGITIEEVYKTLGLHGIKD